MKFLCSGCHCGWCENSLINISDIFSHLQKISKISTVHISQMFLYQTDLFSFSRIASKLFLIQCMKKYL